MTRFGILALASTFAVAAAPLRAQQAPAGVRGEILAQFDEAADKLVQLAEAIPQDKFTWRPGAGVRSVSEVFLHVAGSNHYMLTAVGVPAATQGENDLERSTTDKAQIIAQLKAANASVRAAIQAMRDADLDKATRGVCLLLQSHVHEHLGQMIAYARTNGIVPPWSQSGQ
ncbi:MAG TPA: DinB family protein [Gemmatimonadales bacterium]